MRTIHVVALTLALIALSNPDFLHAQVTGTISGYVQDQGGGGEETEQRYGEPCRPFRGASTR